MRIKKKKKFVKPVYNRVITTNTIPFAACGNLSVFNAHRILLMKLINDDAFDFM